MSQKSKQQCITVSPDQTHLWSGRQICYSQRILYKTKRLQLYCIVTLAKANAKDGKSKVNIFFRTSHVLKVWTWFLHTTGMAVNLYMWLFNPSSLFVCTCPACTAHHCQQCLARHAAQAACHTDLQHTTELSLVHHIHHIRANQSQLPSEQDQRGTMYGDLPAPSCDTQDVPV